ncbi:telomeric repeat-binding factor 2-interacting protein 1 [Astyanax mexicanus]|uniref:telomeric repeat-binding factor 2-interacting protein 1 n=1 Tax=Astyanax mexicanus TaxID=7994 RepID=UPI0020CB53EA|nr:telomeric repeat-binding factor 2-interacting protein 1 [Astyanax mexicanus]
MAAVKKESSDPSPVLFLNTKGEPMRFFIRPGPTKMQLQPLIQDCGGVVCRTQEPNAILLAEPGEVSAATDGAGQFYISTQYIRDCVTQNQQLDMKTYRLSSQINPAIQTRSASRKQRGSGRMGYSLEDDTAILDFITHRRQEAKGNRVWQEMERKLVTSHSWQSMKYRYLKHLQFKQTNKSPEKRKKSLNFKESFSSEENTIQSSPQKKKQKTTQIASSSDSEATDAQGSRTAEGTSADQSELELEPVQNSASPLRPDLEGEIQPCAQSDGNETEVSGDKPDLGSSHEEEKQKQQQQKCKVSSAERAGMDEDGAGEGTSEGPKIQQTTPREIRQKSPSSKLHGRKLGILERAAREFEDSQMTDDGESQEGRPLSRASSDNSDTDEGQITAARERAVREQQANAEQNMNTEQSAAETQSSRPTPGPGDDAAAGPSSTAVPVTSNAHNFIFDQDSQEDLSPSSQRQPVPQDFLQAKEHVVKLMQDCKKDLMEVMKALLKASGDVTLARSYLLNGYKAEVHGPIWTRHDDEVLLSAGSSELDQLREKFGEDRVLKRAEFLKAR